MSRIESYEKIVPGIAIGGVIGTVGGFYLAQQTKTNVSSMLGLQNNEAFQYLWPLAGGFFGLFLGTEFSRKLLGYS